MLLGEEEMNKTFSEHLKSGIPIQISKELYSWSSEDLFNFAASKNISSEHLNELTKLDSLFLDKRISINPNISKETIENLIKKYIHRFPPFIHHISYKSRNPDILDFLYQLSNDYVLRTNLLCNPRTSDKILEDMIDNYPREVEIEISSRKNLSQKIIEKLLYSKNRVVLIKLLFQKRITLRQKIKLKRLHKDEYNISLFYRTVSVKEINKPLLHLIKMYTD